jgi:hypothetical protein
MDPLYHPDLVAVDARMQQRFDAVIAAEREAALVAYRRSQTLRDRFLEAEDRASPVVVLLADGTEWSGTIREVGLDHVMVGPTYVALAHVLALRVGR